MSDKITTVEDLSLMIAQFVKERDWEQFHNPKDLALAVSVEAGELLETFLWEGVGGWTQAREDEIADAVIYCLAFANVTGIDLSSAIRHKLAKSAEKYPVDEWKGRVR